MDLHPGRRLGHVFQDSWRSGATTWPAEKHSFASLSAVFARPRTHQSADQSLAVSHSSFHTGFEPKFPGRSTQRCFGTASDTGDGIASADTQLIPLTKDSNIGHATVAWRPDSHECSFGGVGTLGFLCRWLAIGSISNAWVISREHQHQDDTETRFASDCSKQT